MGLMDKVKAQATQLAQQAQDTARDGKAKFDQSQASKRSDVLLRDLGAAVYAERTGRGTGDSQAQIDKLVADISAHEAQNGISLTGTADQQQQGPPAYSPPGEFLPGPGAPASSTFTDPGVPPSAPGTGAAAPSFPGAGAAPSFPGGGTSTSFPDAGAAPSFPDTGSGSALPDADTTSSFPDDTPPES
jgi:hypothetical protein